MKILQVHNFYQMSGGECSVVRAEKQLLERGGHKVLQFTKDSSDIHRMSPAKKLLLLQSIPYNRRIYKKLISLLQVNRPDVAHIHNLYPMLSPSVYSALYKAKIPIVYTHHNFRVLCPDALYFKNGRICEECASGFSSCIRGKCVKDSYILSILYASAIQSCWKKGFFTKHINRHITLNTFFADKLSAHGVPQEKIRIVPNFVSRLNEKPSTKQPYLLYIGRLSEEKGLFTLLEAAGKAGTHVLIAGTGPLEQLLRDYIASHNTDNVELIGYTTGKEKNKLLEESMATVIPSLWYENFTISAIESFAAGTAVIASNSGGLPETIVHGKNGFLFEPGNAAELAAIMEKLENNPELISSLSHHALNHAKERFSPAIHLCQLEGVYSEAIVSTEVEKNSFCRRDV